MAAFAGTSGNDTLTGTATADTFNLIQGGEDTASGLGGNDVFSLGRTLDAGDAINGGTGNDQLYIRGDYSDGVTFGATTVANITRLALGPGFDYNLTTNDATVAAGDTMLIDASLLGAGDTLTFNGSAETDGRFHFIGGAGADTITGGNHGDIFDMRQGGGADSITGGAGDDLILGGANFNSNVTVDGGGGNNVLRLDGDYSAGLQLIAGSLSNVDVIQVDAGHDYVITPDPSLFASGTELFVTASKLGAGNSLTFDGTFNGVQSGAKFIFTDGAGNDTLIGGRQGDTFDLTHGGNDTADGASGNDVFTLGSKLTAADQIDGGNGNDTVSLDGHYDLTLTTSTIRNVETLTFAAGHSYSITTNDGTVASSATLTADGSALGASDVLNFNGALESAGHFDLIGGAGGDHLTGGAGTDRIFGGLGADTLTGGGGQDTFVYTAAAQSNDANVDHVGDFDSDSDLFQFPFVVTAVSTISAAVNDLDASLGTAINDALPAHGALVVKVNLGLLAGHTYLVVDANGDALYTPGTDYVINITGAPHIADITTANFTTS